MTNYQTAPDGKSILWRFFANPIVGMIGSVASLVGVMLAIYFYFQGIESPEVVYFINPARATIVKYGQSTLLTVRKGDRTIESDVSAVQIAMWNRGKQSVRPANVLSPISVSINTAGDQTNILEASIRKVSRNLIGLKLNNSRMEQGEIRLAFDILEQDDGRIVQIIYEGTPDLKFEVLGIIEEQGDVREIPFEKETVTRLGYLTIVTGFLMLVAVISMSLMRHTNVGRLLPEVLPIFRPNFPADRDVSS